MNFIDIYIFVDRIEFDIYSIENEQKVCKQKDRIIIPKSFDIGSKLAYVRNNIDTLIRQYKLKNANINTGNNIDGVQILKLEGVIEELISNSGVEIWR